MVKYNASFLEELRNRVPVSSVISRSIKLQRKGSSGQWLGLCPFHKEKTPSFTVNDDKGFYHCFGCGTSGDIIDFEMQINRLSFIEAIEKLANDAGMPIPKSNPKEIEQEKKKASLYQVLDLSAKFFYDKLYSEEGKEALEYLYKRGLDDDIIAKFRLGFAPKDSNLLKTYLFANGIEAEQLLKAGLSKKSEHDASEYTYFKNRVMFPISDHKGRIIAFGGRIMDSNGPKYLNSPETEIFNKGENLYGLSQAIKSIREHENAILVEGYMDVISLVKAGINYAIAPLGTALTEKQIIKIWGYTNEPCICLDNDTAGRNAMFKSALRTLPILKAGYSIKFMYVEGAKDPDEFINARGKEAFLNLSTKSLDEVLWEYLTNTFRFDTPEQKARFEIEISSLLNNITDEKVKGYYLTEFRSRLRERIYGKKYQKKKNAPNITKIPIKTGESEAKILIAYCLLFPEVAKDFVEEYYNYRSLKIESGETNNYLSKIMDILTIETDINESSMKEILKNNNLNAVYTVSVSEIEMINKRFSKNFSSNEEKFLSVKKDFGQRLLNYKIFAINKEIARIKDDAKISDIPLKNDVWERYIYLKEEKERLENINF